MAPMRRSRAWIPAAVALAAAGCAAPSPVEGLWPPRPDEPVRYVVVSVDSWHGMVGLPQEDGTIEEWGFAERAWYLEHRQGSSGAVRALCWPTDGVVEVVRGRVPWAARTPQPPARMWEFRLTEAGYARLTDWLRESRADPESVSREAGRSWYASRRDYCFCHNCHHWLAAALRAAGLPTAPACAFTAGELTRQLDRAMIYE